MLTGSLGMLPSASLGEPDPETKIPRAMYEPVHGSAPDISGQGVSNPLAMILSVGMMFEYSLDKKVIAEKINDAVRSVLEKGFRTKDIYSENKILLSTNEMGDKVLEEIKE